MPAVQLARLRIQTTRLAESFDDPGEFSRGLDSLLELYGNRAFRPGFDAVDRSSLPAYHVPPLVMRQLEIELGQISKTNPVVCLQIIDRLWQSPVLEMRLVAIYLLGEIPASQTEEVKARLKTWCNPAEDTAVLLDLLSIGGKNIRKHSPLAWLEICEEWLGDIDPQILKIGLRALEPFLVEYQMEHLPRVFNLLEAPLRNPSHAVMTEIEVVITQLYAISPMETQFFIRNCLENKPDQQCLRLIRRLLPGFSGETQTYLRSYFPVVQREPGK
jgi:hypothetical protein